MKFTRTCMRGDYLEIRVSQLRTRAVELSFAMDLSGKCMCGVRYAGTLGDYSLKDLTSPAPPSLRLTNSGQD
jgi:hypothetical protein